MRVQKTKEGLISFDTVWLLVKEGLVKTQNIEAFLRSCEKCIGFLLFFPRNGGRREKRREKIKKKFKRSRPS